MDQKVSFAPAVAKLIIEIDFDELSFGRDGVLLVEELTEALDEVRDEVMAGVDEGDTQGIITDDEGNLSWKWRLEKTEPGAEICLCVGNKTCKVQGECTGEIKTYEDGFSRNMCEPCSTVRCDLPSDDDVANAYTRASSYTGQNRE